MTTSAPPPVTPDQPDPHASKIDPNDPRLRLTPPRGRTLRTAPIIALVIGVLGLVAVALLVSFHPATPAGKDADKVTPEPTGPIPTAAVPDLIRHPPAPPPSGLPMDRLAMLAAMHSRDAGADSAAPPHPVAAGGARRPDPAQELAMRAASAAPLFEIHADPTPVGATAATASPPSEGLGAVATGASPPAARTSDADPNLQEHKTAFLGASTPAAAASSDTLTATLHHPTSPYEIQAGTIVPAVLITAIDSDLPGPVIGQVRENVFDSITGNTLLIPQGARLIANYDSQVVWGQERVLMCWQRLVLPNGDSLNLQCQPAADLQGAAGLTDQVDEHWWRILKGAAVASLLAATAQGVAGNTGPQGYTPTVPQMWAQNGSAQVNQVGQRITQRNLDIQPTITVRPGWSLNVVVTKDIILPPYTGETTISPSLSSPTVR